MCSPTGERRFWWRTPSLTRTVQSTPSTAKPFLRNRSWDSHHGQCWEAISKDWVHLMKLYRSTILNHWWLVILRVKKPSYVSKHNLKQWVQYTECVCKPQRAYSVGQGRDGQKGQGAKPANPVQACPHSKHTGKLTNSQTITGAKIQWGFISYHISIGFFYKT